MQYTNKPTLPGLVIVFLLLSYGWAISLVLAALGLIGVHFFDRYAFGGEVLTWTVFCLAAALCAVFAVISIHTRNTSAPGVCRVLCIILIALYALLAIRFLALAMDGGRFFRFGGNSSYAVLIPAMLSAFIPFFVGWFRYFSVSPRIQETFGIAAPAAAKNIPSLGVGLLRVLCGMAFTGSSLALLALFASIGAGAGGLLFSLSLVLLPGILFPLTLYAVVLKPGAKAMTVSFLLWAWAFFTSFIDVSWLWVVASEYGMSLSALSNFFWLLKIIPFPVISLAIFAAALSWRFISSPEEGTWLRQPSQTGRALYARLPLAAFFILYTVFAYASAFSISPVHGIIGLGLGALALWAASSRLNTDVPYRDQRNRDMAILILFTALLLITVIMRFTAPREVLQHTLLYLGGDILRAGICVYVAMVLAKERIGQRSPFAMPLPAGAFYLFCICTLIGGCLTLAMLGYASLAGFSREGIYHNGFDLHSFFYLPGFWIGSFICPGIATFLFTKKVPSVGALIAVCVVWLLAAGFTEAMVLTGAMRGAVGAGFSLPEWFRLSTVLPLFVAYILYSKEFAAWRYIGHRAQTKDTAA